MPDAFGLPNLFDVTQSEFRVSPPAYTPPASVPLPASRQAPVQAPDVNPSMVVYTSNPGRIFTASRQPVVAPVAATSAWLKVALGAAIIAAGYFIFMRKSHA